MGRRRKNYGDEYISTTSKRFGYLIVKILHPGYEPKKFWIYIPSHDSEPEKFVKEMPTWESSVAWCRLNRRDGKKNPWDN